MIWFHNKSKGSAEAQEGPLSDFVFIFHFSVFVFNFLLFTSPFCLSAENFVFIFYQVPFSFLTFWFSLRYFGFQFLFFYFSLFISNFFIFTDLFRSTLQFIALTSLFSCFFIYALNSYFQFLFLLLNNIMKWFFSEGRGRLYTLRLP